MTKRLPILLIAVFLSVFSIAAIDASYYSSSSKLAKGRWVKIKVTESGMQQITRKQLLDWGFPDINKVTVYGHGGVTGFDEIINASVADDLAPQPVIYRDDRIIFYGESNCRPDFEFTLSSLASSAVPVVQRNNAADAGYYFITDGLPLPEISEIPFNPSSKTVFDYHYSISFFEEELTNPFRAGQHYFGRDMTAGNSVDLTFEMPDRALDSPLGTKAAIRAILIATSMKESSFNAKVNDFELSFSVPSSDKFHLFNHNSESASSYKTFYVAPTETKVDISLAVTPNSNLTFAALDRLTFAYPRKNILRPGVSELLITTNSISQGDTEVLAVDDSSVRIWNVEKPYNVRPYATSFDADAMTLSFTADADCSTASAKSGNGFRAIAFDPAADHHSVEFAGEVPNQNLHGASIPDFIILTSELCRPQAERLAELHRNHLGQQVLVVGQEEIFNEFSSGTPSTWGIRRAIKMFHDRSVNGGADSPKTRSALLFGGGMFDNRGLFLPASTYLNQGALLLTHGAPDLSIAAFTTISYVSDTYFGICGDSFSRPSLAGQPQDVNIGRIPAFDLPDAVAAVDKIEDYLTNPPCVDVHSRSLIIADYSDENSHLDNAEDVARILLDELPGITNNKAYVALYEIDGADSHLVTSAIARALKNGVGLFSYSGHGRIDALTQTESWTLNDVNSTKYSFYPIAMLATCETYKFDDASTVLASRMVMTKGGGTIGAIAHSRIAYQNENQIFNNAVTKAYAMADHSTLTGDIYRTARNTTIAENPYEERLRNNTFCYNYCGDPALPVYVPAQGIVLTTVNSRPLAADSEPKSEIVPLAMNTIEGNVLTPDGNAVDTEFNGTVVMTLYESPVTRPIFIHKPNTGHMPDHPQDIDLDEEVLCEAVGEVVDGRFSISFSTPTPANSGSHNRMTFFAYSRNSSSHSIASGYTLNIVASGDTAPEIPADTEPPTITRAYINNPEFINGEEIDSSEITLHIEIAPDESGIRKASSIIGGNPHIVIDNNRIFQIPASSFRSMDDGSTHIAMSVPMVDDGRHELRLKVFDNVGNASSATLSFTVISGGTEVKLSVGEYPARTVATVDAECSAPDAPQGRILIEDADGNTVFSREGCSFPFEWNLSDPQGNPVPDGLYTLRAYLMAGQRQCSVSPVSILILR